MSLDIKHIKFIQKYLMNDNDTSEDEKQNNKEGGQKFGNSKFLLKSFILL